MGTRDWQVCSCTVPAYYGTKFRTSKFSATNFSIKVGVWWSSGLDRVSIPVCAVQGADTDTFNYDVGSLQAKLQLY